MIQRLDALQKAIIWDIIETIGLVLITIPIWFLMNINESAAIAEYYDNYFYIQTKELNNPSYKVERMSDKDGLRYVETKDILVSNNTKISDSYYLLLASNDDSNSIRININNKVYNLKDCTQIKKEDNVYYILDSSDLVASSKKYIISLWQDEGAEEDVDFDYRILVQSSI